MQIKTKLTIANGVIVIPCPKTEESETMKDVECDITIKKHREKRSLDSNAYCWVLLGKLADKLDRSAVEIYKELVQDVGDCYHVLPIRNDVLEQWINIWEKSPSTKIGWFVKVLGESKKAKGYTNTMNFYGSSAFDSKQMSRLVELLATECKEQGIETMTPDEIERLDKAWSER